MSGCATHPPWRTVADFPPELALTELDLAALPPDEENLGKSIDQFPNAQLIGGDVLTVATQNGMVGMEYSAYVIPGEKLLIGKAQYAFIVHLFYSQNGGIPTEEGRYLVYDSDPKRKSATERNNHQHVIRNETIKSRRYPDKSNIATTSITTPEAEIPGEPQLVEIRAWCPLVDKRILSYCPITKLALYNTILGRGQIVVASQKLVHFFNHYQSRNGFDHPMLLKLAGESWFSDAKARMAWIRTELLADGELLTEQQLQVLAVLEGRERDAGETGMSSADLYRELRRLDEAARKPNLSWVVEHYLAAYTMGLAARYRPDAFKLSEATLQRWKNGAGEYGVLFWVYQSGYTDGLRGTLDPSMVIGMDCESEKTPRAQRRCEKTKQRVLDEMAKKAKAEQTPALETQKR